jgi:hypothetical protein
LILNHVYICIVILLVTSLGAERCLKKLL